jgi:CBS domain-containing protein
VRGRRGALVVTSAALRRVGSSREEWRDALELLAAAEPDTSVDAAALVGDRAGPAAHALDLVVVTSRLTGSLGDRLLRRASARQATSLVVVDVASFAAGAAVARSVSGDPLVLQLRAAGVAVAVLRRGDDLAAALGRRAAVEKVADA